MLVAARPPTASTKLVYCNNCHKPGHNLHQCRQPLLSVGLIAFRQREGTHEPEFLMIRRAHSFGLMEIMRGKYPLTQRHYLQHIVDELTSNEKQKLLDQSYDTLWLDVWGQTPGIQFRGEEKAAKDKFATLRDGVVVNADTYNLASLVTASTTAWLEPEWEFPKGRHNLKETDLQCGLREFEEETGYDKSQVCVLQNVLPFEEIFMGSNHRAYKTKYYVGWLPQTVQPVRGFQESEVSQVDWKTLSEAQAAIRPYNLEKMALLQQVHSMLVGTMQSH